MHPLFLLTASAVGQLQTIDCRRLPSQREARMVRSFAIREGAVQAPERRPSSADKALSEARAWGFEGGKAARS